MTHGDGRDGDDITPLPPLHLDRGDGGSPAPDDNARDAHHDGAAWRRWAALTTAVVAGVAIGAVATSAADDAADLDRINLVAGNPDSTFDQGAGTQMTGRFQLYNAGPHAVEVLGVALPGWSQAVNPDSTRPVTAEPGTWVTVTAGFDVDCSTEPDRRMDVTVRTPAGKRTVEVEAPPINDQMRWAWEAGCSNNLQTYVDVTLMDVVSRDAGRMVTEVEIHLPGPRTVTSIVSDVPGFAVTAPTPIDANGSVTSNLTWQVSDCGLASTMRDGTLTATLHDDDAPADQVVQAFLDPGFLVELARFAVGVCES